MIKIWNEAFWKDSPRGNDVPGRPVPFTMVAPAVLLACGTILFGLFPGVFYGFAERAAYQLMNPSIYIEAVLGADASPPVTP